MRGDRCSAMYRACSSAPPLMSAPYRCTTIASFIAGVSAAGAIPGRSRADRRPGRRLRCPVKAWRGSDARACRGCASTRLDRRRRRSPTDRRRSSTATGSDASMASSAAAARDGRAGLDCACCPVRLAPSCAVISRAAVSSAQVAATAQRRRPPLTATVARVAAPSGLGTSAAAGRAAGVGVDALPSPAPSVCRSRAPATSVGRFRGC